MAVWYPFVWIHHPLSSHTSADGHLDGAVMTFLAHAFIPRHMPGGGVAGPQTLPTFSLSGCCRNGWIDFHSHQHVCECCCSSTRLSPTFYFYPFRWEQWYLTVVLICFFPKTNIVEHFFICLLATFLPSFVRWLFEFLPFFGKWILSLFLITLWEFIICVCYKSLVRYMYHEYLLTTGLPFTLWRYFDEQMSLIFTWPNV